MKRSEATVVLILGGGTMQVPALRSARERGWTVILADGNPEPEGKHLAHYFENVDLRDASGMIAMASEYAETIGLDGVFTAGTDFSLTVARVADALGLPGLGEKTAAQATYKDRMRACFRKGGVPSPDFRTVKSEEDLSIVKKSLPGPWVVKPVDNMGARGTRRVDNPEQLDEAVRTALSWSGSSTAIVEGYMDGPEFSIDAIVEDGRITICGFADRHIFFPPYFIEMGHTMPSNLPEQDAAEVIRVFRMGVRALGIRNGCAKGDVKLTDKGGMIGEIAARLSGGYMSGWTYPYSSGVDLTGAALNLAVGRPAGDVSPRHAMHSAERAFISIPGIVESVEGIDDASGLPGVKDVFLRASPGDRVCFPRNNVEKCGNIITMASSRKEAIENAEKAAGSVRIRLVPGKDETGQYLFGQQAEGCHPVYPENGTITAMLETLAPWEGDVKALKTGSQPGIMPFNAISKHPARDLYGVTAEEGMKRVLKSGYCSSHGTAECRLGSIFWKAFFRGGAEAGIWALRSFKEDPCGFPEKVRVWSAG